jgi:hypothetical protein
MIVKAYAAALVIPSVRQTLITQTEARDAWR